MCNSLAHHCRHMSDPSAFYRILQSLHDAMLDDAHWPAASALIDELCGLTGNALAVGEGPKADIRVSFLGYYCRGERRTDLEREYLDIYHPIDERVPRLRQLPDSLLAPTQELYTAEELKTSPTFNEILFRNSHQNGLNVRLDMPDGSHVSWVTADPVARSGWESSQVTLIEWLLPHLRQFVRIRQTLVCAGARETTATALLENRRIGAVHLDRRGEILEANDRARHILSNGYGLSGKDGVLRALAPAEQRRLQRLVAGALPADGTVAVSGSMPLRCSSGKPRLVVHVKPAGVPPPAFGGRHAAALVLLVEPARRPRIDPDLVAESLELTPGESQVAVWLAEGKSVDEMARATGRTKKAVYWHLQQIYQKHHISRQADLVRLILSVAELG